jgi:uncharacterized membrane protein YagU involved in acid resistance
VERSVPLREEIKAGVLAGVAGGIAIEVFYFLTMLPGGQAVKTLLGSFAFVSSVLIGPSAYSNPAAVPLGIVLHFCVSIGWALGYVYLTRTQRQLIDHPWISGAGFGLVVYVFMQLVLLTAGVYHRPSSPEELTVQLVSHIVFYGIPVALVASHLLRTSSTASGTAV